MISRVRPGILVFLALLSAGGTSCQKVPLLAPSGSSITLTTTATTLPLNGSVEIIAQVIEQAGTPPQSGTHVTFTTSLGSVQPSEVETDVNGRASAIFNAGTSSGTATISALSGGATTGSTGALKIAIGAAAAARLVVSANPGTVPATGGTSAIVANVVDTNGNILPGVPVTFSTDNGSLSSAVAITDQVGNAQTTLTTNKTAKVTATAGTQTGTSGGTTTTPTPLTQIVTVNVNAASSLTVGSPSPASPYVGQAVSFPITYTQNTNGSPVARVVVDFGDGSQAQTFTGAPSAVTHTYNVQGTFGVRVTAFDTFGDTASGSGSVTITARPQVIVGITSTPANPGAGVPVTFTITAVPTTGQSITSVTVDLGDGNRRVLSGAVASLQYAYSAPGTYVVTANATDSFGATGSATTSVVVGSQPQPVVSLSVSTQNPAAGTDVAFTASVAPPTGTGTVIRNVTIDYGEPGVPKTDLGPVTGTSIALHHVYQAGGTYTATLTATDSNGAVGTSVTTVFVQAAVPLGVTLSASVTTGPVTSTVSFTATVTGLGNAVVQSYLWNFGNGDPPQTTTTNQITHQYAHGTTNYNPSVTVTTSDNRTASNSTVITP